MVGGRVTALSVHDVRFPTSLAGHGSDAMHTDPDYSAAYVIIETDAKDGLKGYGITFTLGKGTEVVVCAIKALSHHVLDKDLGDIVRDFRGFYRQLTSDGQLRWIGPEKGVVHLATAAVLNALWDLWAKQEGKPLWKLLVDMDPKQLISCIDFRYITDALTEEEAYEILQKGSIGKKEREEQMLEYGYPAYTTSCAWLGYSDQQLKKMVDANQRWDVPEAIEWMLKLAEFKPLWIEEPTSPDDVLGHATISKALAPLGIGVATGEQCQNRVIFKQLLQAEALQFLQIDSCRLGSVNENLSVLLMAKKFQIPVCPHAGGVGLCELVQHLIIFDYISISGSLENRICEYVDHLHEHFKYPVVIKKASYMPPKDAGYSTEMKEESVKKHQFPGGEVWQKLLAAQQN
ncbi:mitochondrial enolase superfamily member 1 isoform X2 [Sarcophilus harrisii]|uniref:mitochondrial enolase superfamily member 1 isoform X2 n=1 Tax=Sarcophilus harrisii TaxID=9305 RepID=UPI001301D664|nr:mitochondrial enolase superfamily member 1 isoform X2 [Sarcophilus harrisii]